MDEPKMYLQADGKKYPISEYDLEVLGLPRGPGDPDVYGYPGQEEEEQDASTEDQTS